MLYSLMKNVHSKHEYFDEHLKKERDQSNTINNKLFQLKQEAGNNLDTDDLICRRCWYSIYRLNYNSMSSYILKNNKRIKKSYDDTLYPLQNLLIFIYYINTSLMATTFEKPFRLFFISTLFAIINLWIQAELFIADKPNVYYTIIIGCWTVLFSIFLLLKIIITLLTIVHYRIMKNILTNE